MLKYILIHLCIFCHRDVSDYVLLNINHLYIIESLNSTETPTAGKSNPSVLICTADDIIVITN